MLVFAVLTILLLRRLFSKIEDLLQRTEADYTLFWRQLAILPDTLLSSSPPIATATAMPSAGGAVADSDGDAEEEEGRWSQEVLLAPLRDVFYKPLDKASKGAWTLLLSEWLEIVKEEIDAANSADVSAEASAGASTASAGDDAVSSAVAGAAADASAGSGADARSGAAVESKEQDRAEAVEAVEAPKATATGEEEGGGLGSGGLGGKEGGSGGEAGGRGFVSGAEVAASMRRVSPKVGWYIVT